MCGVSKTSFCNHGPSSMRLLIACDFAGMIENDYVTTTSYKAVKFENSCLSRNNIF